jgi:hypothetical protein
MLGTTQDQRRFTLMTVPKETTWKMSQALARTNPTSLAAMVVSLIGQTLNKTQRLMMPAAWRYESGSRASVHSPKV